MYETKVQFIHKKKLYIYIYIYIYIYYLLYETKVQFIHKKKLYIYIYLICSMEEKKKNTTILNRVGCHFKDTSCTGIRLMCRACAAVLGLASESGCSGPGVPGWRS